MTLVELLEVVDVDQCQATLESVARDLALVGREVLSNNWSVPRLVNGSVNVNAAGGASTFAPSSWAATSEDFSSSWAISRSRAATRASASRRRLRAATPYQRRRSRRVSTAQRGSRPLLDFCTCRGATPVLVAKLFLQPISLLVRENAVFSQSNRNRPGRVGQSSNAPLANLSLIAATVRLSSSVELSMTCDSYSPRSRKTS